MKWRFLVAGTLVALLTIITATGMGVELHGSKPTLAVKQPTAEAALAVFYGQWFGSVRDNKGIHHYVVFNTNGMRRSCWRATAPPGWGWTDPQPWPQVSPYYVQAGFRWPDGVNPYLFLKPSDFKLYPC